MADGHVFDRHPDTAYGTDETAIAKLVTTPDWNRLAYFRFDLSALPGPPAAASFELSTVSTNAPGLHALQVLSPTGWDEASLTWNTKPEPGGPPLAVWMPTTGQRVSADLSAVSPAGTMELAVIPLTRTYDGLTHYGTRENADEALRPALQLMIARAEIEIWRRERFGEAADDPAIAGDSADPDRDGLPNAIEFVLGTDPGADSSAHRPDGWIDGESHILSFRRSHASADEDVFVEVSTDLDSWSRLEDGTGGVEFSLSPEPGESGIDRWEVSLPKEESPGARSFLRLGIER